MKHLKCKINYNIVWTRCSLKGEKGIFLKNPKFYPIFLGAPLVSVILLNMDGDEGILACYPKMRPLSMGFLSPHREDDLFWRIKFPFLQRNTKAVQCSRRLNTMWISNAGPCSESRIDWFLILRPTIQNRVINLLQKWESTRYEKWMLNRKLKVRVVQQIVNIYKNLLPPFLCRHACKYICLQSTCTHTLPSVTEFKCRMINSC